MIPTYAEKWVAACRECGIETVEISPAQALKQEPFLNPQLQRAFRVPDAACDSFDILTALGAAVQQHGGTVLTDHEVVGLGVAGGKVTGATLRNRRTGEERFVGAALVVNAAGAWAGQIAAMAGCPLTVRPSKGTMVAMAYRFVNTIINRLHKPGDGDILVPVGTVAVIGTTSVNVADPNDTSVQPWEVQLMLDEGEKMVPGFSQVRALRAWAGVRPLYEEGAGTEGREAKRTFAVLDHAARDGVGGLVTVVGGKFTTYRLMAERAADAVCAQLGVTKPCVTKSFVLPDVRIPINPPKPHRLGHRLEDLEEGRCQRPVDLRVRDRHPQGAGGGRRGARGRGRAVDPGRPAPRSAAGHGTVPGRLLRGARRGHPARIGRAGRCAGHGGPRRLRAAALEGSAPAAVGTGLAAGAAGRADLPRAFWAWIDCRRLREEEPPIVRTRVAQTLSVTLQER